MRILAILRAYLHENIGFTDLMELLAVVLGKKSVARFTGLPETLERFSSLMREINISFKIPPIHLETQYENTIYDTFSKLSPGHATDMEEGILFAGDPDSIQKAIDLETNGCPADKTANLYGYPDCCAQNYENNIQRKVYWTDSFFRSSKPIENGSWMMNRLGRLFSPYLSILPDYFPCSFKCSKSLKLSEEYSSLLETAGLSSLLDLAKEHLSRPVLRHAGCIYWLRPFQKPLFFEEGEPFEAEVMEVLSYEGIRLSGGALTLSYKDSFLTVNNGEANNDLFADTTLLLFD
jgi:hypothetical protein